MPSVGQTFHDTFTAVERNAFLDKTQTEATGMVKPAYKPSFKILHNGLDKTGEIMENGKTNNTSPAKISPKPADDLISEIAETSDSVQADLTQIATSSMIVISRRNFYIIIGMVIFIVIFLIAIFKK